MDVERWITNYDYSVVLHQSCQLGVSFDLNQINLSWRSVVVSLAMTLVAMIVVRVGNGNDNEAVQGFNGFSLLEKCLKF